MEPSWMVSSQKIENEPEVNAMMYKTNTIQKRNDVIDQVIRDEALYAVGMLRMAVYLRHDPNLYIVILNNETEINMMHFLMIIKLGLVMMQLNHGLMISTNQLKSKFLEIAEDIPVLVGSF